MLSRRASPSSAATAIADQALALGRVRPSPLAPATVAAIAGGAIGLVAGSAAAVIADQALALGRVRPSPLAPATVAAIAGR